MTSSSPGFSPKTLTALVILLAFLLIGAGILLPTDPLIAARIDSFFHPSAMPRQDFNPDDAAKNDPHFGIGLPETGAGKALRKLPASEHGYLIIALGDCAQCMHFDFNSWQSEGASLHVPVIGISGASLDEIAIFKRESHITMPIQFDLMDRLQNGLNAYWAGRAYYFDKDWKLQWKMDGFGNPNDLFHQPSLKELIKGEGQ